MGLWFAIFYRKLLNEAPSCFHSNRDIDASNHDSSSIRLLGRNEKQPEELLLGKNKMETHWIGLKAFWVNWSGNFLFCCCCPGELHSFRHNQDSTSYSATLMPPPRGFCAANFLKQCDSSCPLKTRNDAFFLLEESRKKQGSQNYDPRKDSNFAKARKLLREYLDYQSKNSALQLFKSLKEIEAVCMLQKNDMAALKYKKEAESILLIAFSELPEEEIFTPFLSKDVLSLNEEDLGEWRKCLDERYLGDEKAFTRNIANTLKYISIIMKMRKKYARALQSIQDINILFSKSDLSLEEINNFYSFAEIY